MSSGQNPGIADIKSKVGERNLLEIKKMEEVGGKLQTMDYHRSQGNARFKEGMVKKKTRNGQLKELKLTFGLGNE